MTHYINEQNKIKEGKPLKEFQCIYKAIDHWTNTLKKPYIPNKYPEQVQAGKIPSKGDWILLDNGQVQKGRVMMAFDSEEQAQEYLDTVKQANDIKKPITCVTENLTFKSLLDCANHYGINYAYLSAQASKGTFTIKGLEFTTNNAQAQQKTKPKRKRIKCLTDGQEFDTFLACATHYDLAYSYLSTQAAKGTFTIKGLEFTTTGEAPEKPTKKHTIKCLTDNRTFKTITECAAYYGIDSYYLANKTKYNSATIKGLQFTRIT